MIMFNSITDIEQFSQIEIRQHILLSIAKFTNGAPYEPSIYGRFVLVEPGDTIAEIEAATSCQIIFDRFNNSRYGEDTFQSSFEWLVEYPSFYEAVFVLTDDGYGIDLLVPKSLGIDTELLDMCAEYAVPA